MTDGSRGAAQLLTLSHALCCQVLPVLPVVVPVLLEALSGLEDARLNYVEQVGGVTPGGLSVFFCHDQPSGVGCGDPNRQGMVIFEGGGGGTMWSGGWWHPFKRGFYTRKQVDSVGWFSRVS